MWCGQIYTSCRKPWGQSRDRSTGDICRWTWYCGTWMCDHDGTHAQMELRELWCKPFVMRAHCNSMKGRSSSKVYTPTCIHVSYNLKHYIVLDHNTIWCNIYIYTYIYISLSLYIYIYIHMCSALISRHLCCAKPSRYYANDFNTCIHVYIYIYMHIRMYICICILCMYTIYYKVI